MKADESTPPSDDVTEEEAGAVEAGEVKPGSREEEAERAKEREAELPEG
ncbi:MAG: hypothetical protein ACR2NH_08530 [Solirubrobacteraceae bacterium]